MARVASGASRHRSTGTPVRRFPRFTALNHNERARLREILLDWGRLALPRMRPGGHIFIATNAFICQLFYDALVDGGLEFRGEIIRLVRTLRGGDRPKNAEEEFPGVSSMPKGCYEPWGLFRKPIGSPESVRLLTSVPNWRSAPLPRRAFRGCNPQRAHAATRAGDCEPSQHQTAILPTPDRLRRAALRRGSDCRSFHGVRFNRRCL